MRNFGIHTFILYSYLNKTHHSNVKKEATTEEHENAIEIVIDKFTEEHQNEPAFPASPASRPKAIKVGEALLHYLYSYVYIIFHWFLT